MREPHFTITRHEAFTLQIARYQDERPSKPCARRSDRPKQARINRLRYRRLGRPATGFGRRPPAPLTEAGRASRDRKALALGKLCNVKLIRIGSGPGPDHGPASGS